MSILLNVTKKNPSGHLAVAFQMKVNAAGNILADNYNHRAAVGIRWFADCATCRKSLGAFEDRADAEEAAQSHRNINSFVYRRVLFELEEKHFRIKFDGDNARMVSLL